MNPNAVFHSYLSRTVAFIGKLLLAFLVCVTLLVGTNRPTYAAPIASTYVLDQSQPAAEGVGVSLGKLSQSFIPIHHNALGYIKIMINRNIPGPFLIKMSVITQNGSLVDTASAVPNPGLGKQMVGFDMGCDGVILIPGATYYIRIEAPTAPVGAYAWMDRGGNPYLLGQGINPLRDYTFWVYTCA